MPSFGHKKEANPFVLEGSPTATRHYPRLQKIAQFPQGTMIWISHDHVVEDLHFEQLPLAYEIPCDFNIAIRLIYASWALSGRWPRGDVNPHVNRVKVIPHNHRGKSLFEGYVVASHVRDGRRIYKVSFSEGPRPEDALDNWIPEDGLEKTT